MKADYTFGRLDRRRHEYDGHKDRERQRRAVKVSYGILSETFNKSAISRKPKVH